MNQYPQLEALYNQIDMYIQDEQYQAAISLCDHMERMCYEAIRGCESFQKALENVRDNGNKLKQNTQVVSTGLRDEIGKILIEMYLGIAEKIVSTADDGSGNTIYELILVLRRMIRIVQERRELARQLQEKKRKEEEELEQGYGARVRTR